MNITNSFSEYKDDVQLEARLNEAQERFFRFTTHYQPHGPCWMGRVPMQLPVDLFSYQEVLYKVVPDIIIETGTLGGGTPLFLCDIYALLKLKGRADKFKIVTVDVNPCDTSLFPEEVVFIQGSSLDVFDEIKEHINPGDKVLVLLDSDHSAEHVYKEMVLYGSLVTVDSYMIVEDGYMDGVLGGDNGPASAIARYMLDYNDFEVNRYYERWVGTQHHTGYLEKVRPR